MSVITIAGGTGLIGRALVKELKSKGNTVFVLTRNPRNEDEIFWDPLQQKMDIEKIQNTQILINLTGEGVADKRWNQRRKQTLRESRVGINEFLKERSADFKDLELFITASGVNCYGYSWEDVLRKENDPFGEDFLSQLVKDWEESADLFNDKCKVAKVRTAVVLTKMGGALEKLNRLIRWNLGSPLASGKQAMPWIHIDDLIGIYVHIINEKLQGAFNAVAGNDSNSSVTGALAKVNNKTILLPNVPKFSLQLLLGEMSSMLTENVSVSNLLILTLL
jgi:uncharacterized protein (TIGR01777 family)